MSIPRNNPSKTGVRMDSMKSMSYTVEAAFADVIDNSIRVINFKAKEK